MTFSHLTGRPFVVGCAHVNIQFLGIGSLLHSFAADRQDRRQYPRIEFRFPLWWLKDVRGSEPVPGIGVEISGGGLQFLLQRELGSQCSLAFQIHDRHIRANVDLLQSTATVFENRPWRHYRAMFAGLNEADFEYLLTLTAEYATTEYATTEHAKAERATLATDLASHACPPEARDRFATRATLSSSLGAYETLPLNIQKTIVEKLVELKRLEPQQEQNPAPLFAHYSGGIKQPNSDKIFHRFFVRSRVNSSSDRLVFNTEVLVNDEGTEVQIISR